MSKSWNCFVLVCAFACNQFVFARQDDAVAMIQVRDPDVEDLAVEDQGDSEPGEDLDGDGQADVPDPAPGDDNIPHDDAESPPLEIEPNQQVDFSNFPNDERVKQYPGPNKQFSIFGRRRRYTKFERGVPRTSKAGGDKVNNDSPSLWSKMGDGLKSAGEKLKPHLEKAGRAVGDLAKKGFHKAKNSISEWWEEAEQKNQERKAERERQIEDARRVADVEEEEDDEEGAESEEDENERGQADEDPKDPEEEAEEEEEVEERTGEGEEDSPGEEDALEEKLEDLEEDMEQTQDRIKDELEELEEDTEHKEEEKEHKEEEKEHKLDSFEEALEIPDTSSDAGSGSGSVSHSSSSVSVSHSSSNSGSSSSSSSSSSISISGADGATVTINGVPVTADESPSKVERNTAKVKKASYKAMLTRRPKQSDRTKQSLEKFAARQKAAKD